MVNKTAKSEYDKINILDKIIIIIMIILVILIALTPLIITKKYFIFDEELFEVMVIIILISFIYISQLFKKKYTQKLLSKINLIQSQKLNTEKQLTESFQYIGKINIQVEEINKYLLNNTMYPKTKGELKKIMLFFAEKILTITPSSFVLLRIIQIEQLKTLTELSIRRGGGIPQYINISNKIVEKTFGNKGKLFWISSTHANTTIKIFSVFDSYEITNQQKILIRAFLNDLEMIFIIYKSMYFKQ